MPISALQPIMASQPFTVTSWLHLGMRIGPNWWGLSAGQM